MNQRPSDGSSLRKVIIFAVILVSVMMLGAGALIAGIQVWLLIFAGILLASFLSTGAEFIQRYCGLNYGASFAVFSLMITVLLVVAGFAIAPQIAGQFDELTRSMPQAYDKLVSQLESYGWARELMNQAGSENMLGGGREMLGRATGVLSGFVGAFANAVIVLFIGLYAGAEPDVYRKGFLRLVPLERRDRVNAVIGEMSQTLRRWLFGKFLSMTIVGVFTTIGLWALDVPLALILGVIAAVLTFIPNIGPVLSAVPAVLMGLVSGPSTALWIILLYLVVQIVESYLITPLIQRRTVHLPPVLIISAQVLLGVLFGALGVALATPFTAVAIVAVKRFYVEDGLGDPVLDSN